MNKGLLVLLILLSTFSACRKKGQPNRVNRITPESLVKKLRESSLQCENFSAKARISVIVDGAKNSFNSQIRMKMDSVIWMSISPGLGIEVFRLVITQDSVFLMDRLNKKAVRAGTNYLDDKMALPLDFGDLQHLILGNVAQMLPRKVLSTVDSNLYKLTARDDDREYQLWIEQEYYRPALLKTRHFKEQEQVTISFTDYKESSIGQFAHERKIELETSMKISSNLNFSSVKSGDNISFPFRIPDGYKNEIY